MLGRPFRRIAWAFLPALLLPASPAAADTTLSAEIVSWQVIGLDHNQPATSAPELFLVQARVTNTGGEAATGVAATLSLGPPDSLCDGGPCITLASSPTVSIGSIAPGASSDAFWTVRIAKTSQAFGTTTPMTIEVVADNAGPVVATQADRDPPPCGTPVTQGSTLYVQGLISQNRNDVLSYAVSPGIQLPDGTWEVVAGSDFTVTVEAQTATNYAEISVPATIDPVGAITPTSVFFTFEKGTPTSDTLYTQNAGGRVTAQYLYNAASVGEVSLAQLIYDCSGGSFHYNSDYGVDFIRIRVVAAPSEPLVTLSKSASPNPALPGDRVTFTITYRNEGAAPATNFVITDQVHPLLNDVVPGPGGAFDPATRIITWNVGTVPGLSEGSVSFTAFVGEAASGQTIPNVAVGTADQFTPISSPPIELIVREITPATGAASAFLAVLGWAFIGFGGAISSRRLARAAL